MGLLAGLVQIAVGLWLLRAAMGKVRGWSSHVRTLAEYTLIPAGVAPLIGSVLVSIEVVLGVVLILGIAQPVTITLTSVLLFAFASVVATDLLRGKRHGCGCGGGDDRISWVLVGRNLLVALTLAATPWLAPASIDAWARVVGVLAVIGAALLVVAAGEVRRATDGRAPSRP
jgi:hypothetical protein